MSDSIPEVDVLEAQKRVREGALLIDVREQNEFDEVRIPGSQLMPLSSFAQHYEELPKDKPLVMQCRSGARSGQATEFLRQHGYDAVNMTGGILAWEQAELPVERGDD